MIGVLSFYVVVITGGLGIVQFRGSSVPLVVRDAVVANSSVLRLAGALGVAAILGMVILQRRRPARKLVPAVVKSHPIMFEQPDPTVHPLFTTPRPSRDHSFVFRKTKKKGQLYRNNAAEKVRQPE